MGFLAARSRRRWNVLSLAAPLVISGCATIVNGSSQNLSVLTDPAGASCVFRREGEVIGVVNPSPGTLSISKSRHRIDVRCQKDGYAEVSGNLGSTFQAAALGNILLGGLIGAIADASSGAATDYPKEISLTLTSLTFSGAGERDRFFADRRLAVRAEAKAARDGLAQPCSDTPCRTAQGRVDDEERAALARIDAEFQSSRIKP